MSEKTDDNREMSPLYTAAIGYGKLLTVGYHIVLGRKGKEYHIQLRFPYDSFLILCLYVFAIKISLIYTIG